MRPVPPYRIHERYEVPCLICKGTGCLNCHYSGIEPVYVIVRDGKFNLLCFVFNHKVLGHTERAVQASDLPRVAWCARCDWQQVHTDTPEAYDPGNPPP